MAKLNTIYIEVQMFFECKTTVENDTIKLDLHGAIVENSRFPMYNFENYKAIITRLDKVKYINSTGIKIWIQYFQEVRKKNPAIQLIFSHCPKVIVDQMNTIKNFLPIPASVTSFYIPYFCSKCLVGHDFEVTSDKHYSPGRATVNIATPKCPTCSKELELDTLPLKYFHFLSKIS